MKKSAGKISVTTGTEPVDQGPESVGAEPDVAAVEADAALAVDGLGDGDPAVRRLLRRAARANRAALDRLAR